MWDFDLMAATRTLEKSMPFVLYRFLLCLGIGLGYLLATLAGAGTLIGFASLAKNANAMGPVGAVIGFAAFGYLLYKARPLWLRIAQVPQLGLLADLSANVDLPAGAAQIDYAKQKAGRAFPSTSALFRLDQLARGALADLVRLPPPAGFLAHPKLAEFRDRLARHIFARSDRSLLAWHFRTGSDTPAASLAAGVAVHGQHFRTLMRNRILAIVFEWVGFALAYPLLLAGIRMLVEGLPINVSFWPYVFAGVFGWVLKAGFFEPIAEAAMLQVFFPLAEQGADPARTAELASSSVAFRELSGEGAGQG
jgi:hypothetical protein